jgi:hypothetical protein
VHASTRKRLKNSTDHPIFGEWEARFAAQPNVRLGVRAQEALTLISIKMDGSSDMSGEGSKSEVTAHQDEVRFTPETGHRLAFMSTRSNWRTIFSKKSDPTLG